MGQNWWQRPAGHILHLPLSSQNQFFGLLLYFKKLDPTWTYVFFIFQPPYKWKDHSPKGKKMRMDHPFILGFCQKVTVDIVFYNIYNHFITFWSKPTFLNYCHILIVLCISDSNIGDPILLLLLLSWLFQIELLFRN